MPAWRLGKLGPAKLISAQRPPLLPPAMRCSELNKPLPPNRDEARYIVFDGDVDAVRRPALMRVDRPSSPAPAPQTSPRAAARLEPALTAGTSLPGVP